MDELLNALGAGEINPMRKPESKARPLPSRRLFALALLALAVSSGCERAAGPALRFEERPRAVAPQAARDPQLLVRASGSVAVLALSLIHI